MAVPISAPLAKKSTFWIGLLPAAGAAVTSNVAGAANTVPPAGAVRVTVGGAFTTMVIGADVAVSPVLSVTTAVSW